MFVDTSVLGLVDAGSVGTSKRRACATQATTVNANITLDTLMFCF